jgi:hypothetical protein
MIINLKREALTVDNNELTSFYNVAEKIVQRNSQPGYVKRLDLTWDEEKVMKDIYHRLSPLFGVDSHEIKRDVTIQASIRQTQE